MPTCLAYRFSDTFDISLVTNTLQLEQAQRIRYRVYCQEKAYEPAFRFPDERERDDYDRHAHHCLVTHRETGLAAACIRLVEAYEDVEIPFEANCGQSIYTEFAGLINADRDKVGEFSRIAVDPTFRGAGVMGMADAATDFSAADRAMFPLISVAVLVAAFALAELSSREHIFAMMEQSLGRMMARAGIRIEPAGVEVDYHGRRRLHYANTHAVASGLPTEVRELYESVYADFTRSISKQQQRA